MMATKSIVVQNVKTQHWERYYKVLAGKAARKTKELRDGLAEMGEEECPIASSFHPLAAIKIAAATIAYEKEFGCENETIGTF